MSDAVPWLISALVAGLGLALQWRGLRAASRARLLEDLPTVPAASVSVGLFEVAGRAATSAPARSVIAGVECVLHRWSVSEEFRRVRTDVGASRNGRAQTRTRVEQGWQRIAGDAQLNAFQVRDDSGHVRVDPAGAQLALQTFESTTVGRGDPAYTRFAPAGAIPDSTGRRKLVDVGLALDAEVFVVGRAAWIDQGAEVEIRRDEEAELFAISAAGERGVRRAQRRGGWFQLALAALLLAGAGFLALRIPSAESGLDPRWGLAAGLALFAAVQGVGWVLFTYNSGVDLHRRVLRAASSIDIELQRRADLLPRLVACVEAFSDHESRVQTTLAEMRSAARATPVGQPGEGARAVADRLDVLLEAYPQLEADASFRDLADELVATEDRIARVRGTYNDFAERFNTRLGQVPGGWVIARHHAERVSLLEADAFAREPVDAGA